ncbi:MAG: MerR family DNA-binding protein [Rhodospirillales bacterium]
MAGVRQVREPIDAARRSVARGVRTPRHWACAAGTPVVSIRELIDLQTQPHQDCGSIDVITRRQLTDVRKRVSQLKALERELGRMLKACAGGRVESGRVLAALNERGRDTG